MRSAIATFTCVLWLSSPTNAAFTDFSDYAQTTAFSSGETFSSQGLSFRAVDRLAIANPVRVFASATQGYAALYAGPGVEFVLPPNVQEASFYYDDGAGARIAINGREPPYYPGQGGVPYQAGFGFLNGASLGGVTVSTVLSQDFINGEIGVLTLRGPLDSLVIAGLELSIDNVSVIVPEPAAASFAIIPAIAALARRRTRR